MLFESPVLVYVEIIMRIVLTVNVEIEGRQHLVGRIEGNDPSDARFCYAADYLEDPLSRPISISLPLRKEPYTAEETRCFFEGLLPEGFTRRSVAHYIHADVGDYLAILASLGKECLGAIKIGSGKMAEDEEDYEKLSIDKVTALAREGATKSAQLVTKAHLSLTGASGKVGLYYDKDHDEWYLPKGAAPSTHIVKQSHIRLEGIVINEQLAIRTASHMGIEVPDSFIINVGNSEDEDVLYATRRFDRVFSPGADCVSGMTKPYRLHQEDFAQALGITSAGKYEIRKEGYFRKMFDLLRKYSSRPVEDQTKLWDIVIFDYLIGNTDNHLKNYSLLYDEHLKGIRLAPAYDILSTCVYPDSTRDMAFFIGDECSLDDINRKSFRKAAEEVGLGSRFALKRFDNQCQHFHQALEAAVSEMSQLGFYRAETIGKGILRYGGISKI